MAGLVPFNRRRGFGARFGDELTNMVDDFFGDDGWFPRNLLRDSFKMDIAEDEKSYCLEVELPGVKKEEIGIDLSNGRLTISVMKEENVEDDKNKNFLHRERRCSSMKRSVFLRDAKEDGISAKLTDGVLTVTVPKDNSAETKRKIEIQ